LGLVGAGARALDVIVAPATPPGVSALAIVRLSGPFEGVERVAAALAPALRTGGEERKARLVTVLDAEGAPLDELVAIRYLAPRSPTGEDVLELMCHGSPAIVSGLLAAARAAGARPAAPGEFTRRALANGRVDLVKAEGLARLCAAETREDARRSLALVSGALSSRLGGARERLLDVLAALEAALDFAEDVEETQAAATAEALDSVREELLFLSASAERVRPERAPRVVLAGLPNAGKSTLFNALVGFDRAIVTPRPGTTRDAVSETVALAGTLVTLVDTAGVRESEDEVERIGVDVARRAAAGADLVLWLVDGSTEEPWAPPDGALVVRTKADLPAAARDVAAEAEVSALTGRGLEELVGLVAARLGTSEATDGLLVLARHGEALRAAASALEAASDLARRRQPTELVASELRRALSALGEVTGETASEELLDRIFSTFCLGK
jgi:tRNA modification GTPase